MTEAEERSEQLPAGTTADVVLAEKAVLASMIANRAAAEELLDVLGPVDCFAVGMHRAVYDAVRWLTEEAPIAGQAAGSGVQRRISAVLGRLVETGHGMWRTGAAGPAISDLMTHMSPAWQADAAKVLRAARQRRTLTALASARQTAARPGWDADENGDMIRGLLDEAMGGALPSAGVVITAAELFTETLDRIEAGEAPGVIRWPWEDLRDLVPYLLPGQLVTVLARPSLGKSVVAQDLCRYTSIRRGLPSILFTLEMDRAQVMDRLIAAEAGVDMGRLTGRALTDDDWDRIGMVGPRFAESELAIDDAPSITLSHIRARLRGMARRNPAQLAVVDYLQLMTPPSGLESRQREIGALTGGLKAMAKEFRIPFVVLAQLNRGPEQRADRRPYLSDARESGSIDTDSDVAILIHREDFHDPESPKAGEAELIVDKNRNGRRGTARVGFHGQYARFVDLAWSPSAAADAAEAA